MLFYRIYSCIRCTYFEKLLGEKLGALCTRNIFYINSSDIKSLIPLQSHAFTKVVGKFGVKIVLFQGIV